MRRISLWFFALLIAVPLIACSDDDSEPEEPTYGSLTIENQELEQADQIAIAGVVSDGPGFVVIHDDEQGEAGEEIGRLEVDDGEHSDLELELDREIQGEEPLIGSLHDENDELATDEEGDAIVVHFTATYEVDEPITPMLSIDDQSADPANEILIAAATAAEDGAVVIHEDDDGEAGDEIGSVDVEEGEHTDLMVTLDRDAEDGELLHGKLTDGAGDIVEVDEQQVMVSFTVSVEDEEVVVTASVEANDQFIADDQADRVVVSQASIEGANGWVVIHDDAEGPGEILGASFIDEGSHDDVEVTLDDDLEGMSILHAMIHSDMPDDGDFTFPDDGDDPPVLDGQDQPVTDSFTYEVVDLNAAAIEVSDQTLESPPLDEITIDSVVYADGDGWVAVFDDQDQLVGQLHLDQPDPGIYNDLTLTLDEAIDGETDLRAQLHEDVAPMGEFNLGDDPQVELAGDPIEADFTVDLLPNELSVSDHDIDGSIDDLDANDSSLVVSLDEVRTRQEVVVELFGDDDGLLLGAASFDYGIHTDIEVVLDRPLEDGQTVTAEMIALDDDEVLTDGSFEVSVADGTPALYFEAEHDGEWSITVEPAAYSDIVDGDDNPSLTLYQDWRFQFRNLSTSSHPLEFLSADEGGIPVIAPPNDDDLHLSQSRDGAYEDEPEVDWREEGASRFAFTVADILVSSDLNTYQDEDGESGGEILLPEAPELQER